MLTHSQIWAAIDALAARYNMSPSGLAKKAGLDPTSFNKSKRTTADGKKRWPSTESISKVLQATQTKLEEFVHLISSIEDFSLQQGSGYLDSNPLAGFDEEQEPFLRHDEEDNVFVYRLMDNSMKPFYKAGDALVISPNAKITRNDRVFVTMTDYKVYIGILKRKGRKEAEIIAFENINETITFNLNEVSSFYKILYVSFK